MWCSLQEVLGDLGAKGYKFRIKKKVKYLYDISKDNQEAHKKTIESSNSNKEYKGLTITGFGQNSMSFHNKIYRQCRFSSLKIKDCILINSQITQSIIDEDSYLRHAIFKNVDFTGTIFRNSNLEKAQFLDCDLKYVKFENCILDSENIINNSMPEHSNLRVGLLNQLYKNELNQGRTDISDNILLELRNEERKMYYDIMKGKTEYYRNEKKKKRGNYYLGKYWSSLISKNVWGYGLSVNRIIFSMTIVWIGFAIIYLGIFSYQVIDALLLSLDSLILGSANILSDHQIIALPVKCIILVQNFIGVIYTALFTSAFYRKVAR